MAAVPGPARPDLGRLVMVPVAAVMLLLDTAALARGAGGSTWHWLGTVPACAFYALTIWCYLRRGPAVATSGSVTAHAAAVAASLAPFAFPLLPAAPGGAIRHGIADVLVLGGTAWAVWSLRFLGRSLSVIAQARDVVDRGPYRWLRHPLYTGELAASLGLALTCGTLAAAALWLSLCVLQGYRAVAEEQVLLQTLPEYRGYRDRTAALLPGVF